MALNVNTESFGDRIGLVKIATIVLGIITCGLIGDSFYNYDSKDEAFLSCVIICLIISTIWAIAVVLDVIQQSENIKKLDMLYHIIAFIFYLITVICFMVSLIKWPTGNTRNKHKLTVRVFAFIFGLITTGAYGYASFLMYHAFGH